MDNKESHQNSDNLIVKEIRESIRKQFYDNDGSSVLYYTLTEIFKMINPPGSPIKFKKDALLAALTYGFKKKLTYGRYKFTLSEIQNGN